MLAIVRGKADAFSVSTLQEHGGEIKDGAPEDWHGFSLAPVGNSCVVVNNVGKRTPGRHEAQITRTLADGQVHTSKEVREACGIFDTTSAEYKEWQRDMAYVGSQDWVTKAGPTTRPTYQAIPTANLQPAA